MTGDSKVPHSAEDPKSLISEAFAMGDEFPGPAEDMLLSWMLSLDMETDARSAAARLLTRYDAVAAQTANPHIARLADLLRQTAAAESSRAGGRGRVAARRAAARGPAS
ncbi:hypothetical protein ACFPL7_19640 [Dongia soli]|uniref:Uncharacterized protein n=1 Tax=Dongia soli TaxID=600628 RepID=A0ABU5E692_9PROT|nr:hypothetical protein [Dongia soli]MDY0881802.1 hypothetical protein [Dongia soli]